MIFPQRHFGFLFTKGIGHVFKRAVDELPKLVVAPRLYGTTNLEHAFMLAK